MILIELYCVADIVVHGQNVVTHHIFCVIFVVTCINTPVKRGTNVMLKIVTLSQFGRQVCFNIKENAIRKKSIPKVNCQELI